MRYPRFNNEEERKQFWSGYLNVRGQVWALVGTKATMEQYMQKAQELAEEYIQQWESERIATEVHEDVTTNDDEVDVTTPIQPAELEEIHIEDNIEQPTPRHIEQSIPRHIEQYTPRKLDTSTHRLIYNSTHRHIEPSTPLHIEPSTPRKSESKRLLAFIIAIVCSICAGHAASGIVDNDFIRSIIFAMVTCFVGSTLTCFLLLPAHE